MEKGWERDKRVGGANFKLTFSHNSRKMKSEHSTEKVGVEPDNLGPVVQSIVSLTSSLRGQLVKCFMTL